MQEMMWITKDKRRYLVSQMDTAHIEHCIAKIKRSKRGWRREYLARLELELNIRNMGLDWKGDI